MAVFDGVSALLSQTFSDLGLSAPVTISRPSAGAYSPATGSRSVTYATETVGAVVEALRRELVEGVAVQAGDLKLIIPAASLSGSAPTTADTVTHGVRAFAILAVSPVMAGSQVITYELHARAN